MGVPHVGPPVFDKSADIVHTAQCQEAYGTRAGHPFLSRCGMRCDRLRDGELQVHRTHSFTLRSVSVKIILKYS